MNDRGLEAVSGLDYVPFPPGIMSDVLSKGPGLEAFVTRAESHTRSGDLSQLTSGTGPSKSEILQMLVDHLDQLAQPAVLPKEQDDE